MKKKYGMIAAALAVFLMLPAFGVTAYAGGDDPEGAAIIDVAAEDTPEAEVPVTDYPKTPPFPFTPSGTATVVDNATDADGKEFYTIVTPDEHIFYLIIDRQRVTENVYFLNAVTIADLAALAELPLNQAPGEAVTPAPVTESPEQPAEAPPEAEQPQEQGGNMGMYIIIALLVIAGGGAGWYFKIYRPKQQGAQGGDEYDPSMDDSENDYPGAWGEDADEDDDNPPWDEDSGDDDGQ